MAISSIVRSLPAMKLSRKPHAMSIKLPKSVLVWLTIHSLVAIRVQAELFSLSASGTISKNSSADTTLPFGTPWTFELIYDTMAPDLDFEFTGRPDSTFGRFTNTGAIPAVTFFHYRAADYEVTIDSPQDFGAFSEIHITFGGVHAIDINLNAPDLFPPLAGKAVSFHADFNDGSHSIFASDALPTETGIGLQSFQDASVTLLPSGDGVVLGGLDEMTSLRVAAVPEPSTSAVAILGGLGLLLRRRAGSRLRLGRLPMES